MAGIGESGYQDREGFGLPDCHGTSKPAGTISPKPAIVTLNSFQLLRKYRVNLPVEGVYLTQYPPKLVRQAFSHAVA